MLGFTGAIAGIIRGHLLFTARMNASRLVGELRRTARTLLVADLAIAGGLFADGLALAATKPLWGVLTMALGLGIALAALLMEPATTEAAFGSPASDSSR